MENPALFEVYNNSSEIPPLYPDNIPQVGNYGKYVNATNILQKYVVPIIILIGLIGNSICFIVFLTSPLKRISTSVYLAALAFSDTGFLFCLAIGWLESLSVRLFHKDGICQLTVYASFVFSFTSIWFVNAFTTEMYIAVFHPQRSPKLCIPRNARKVVGALVVVASLTYLYVFWIAKLVQTPLSNDKVCLIVPEDAQTAMIFSVIDTILTLVVPFTMIIFMITRLFLHISSFYKTELLSMANSTVSETEQDAPENQANGTVPNGNQTARQATDAHSKLTRMLVVTVIMFLVLNLPSHAIKVQFLLRSLLSDHVQFTETEGFIQTVFQILYYANFSINFILYSACGRSFRIALMRTSTSVCFMNCKRIFDCPRNIQALTMKVKATSQGNEPAENGQQNINEQQHSRLVDIHLNDIRYSQLASIDSQFVCQSPPCLLQFDSEQLLETDEGK